MMKNIIYTAVIAIITLSSCNNGEDVMQDDKHESAYNIIRIETGIDTRAGVTSDNLDELGFCVTNNMNPTYSYDNMRMNKVDGVWNSAGLMLWQNATQVVDLLAYSPYQSEFKYSTTTTNANVYVLADQSTAANVKASDFIANRIEGFNPSTSLINGKVPLSMRHLMSKLNITVTLGTEFNKIDEPSPLPISSISINGTVIEGTCNLSRYLFVEVKTSASPTSVTPLLISYQAGETQQTNGVVRYEAILVPQSISAGTFSVSFLIAGKSYEWVSTDPVTIAGGKEYELSLTLGKAIVTAGQMSVSKWIDGDNHDIETE